MRSISGVGKEQWSRGQSRLSCLRRASAWNRPPISCAPKQAERPPAGQQEHSLSTLPWERGHLHACQRGGMCCHCKVDLPQVLALLQACTTPRLYGNKRFQRGMRGPPLVSCFTTNIFTLRRAGGRTSPYFCF